MFIVYFSSTTRNTERFVQKPRYSPHASCCAVPMRH